VIDYFNPRLLAGKVALVTGGATGIGREMARGLGQTGARVVIASRTVAKLEEAVAGLRAAGVDASWRQLDVRDAEQVDAVTAAVVAELGGLDILVNNAGGTFPKRAEDLSANGWRAVVHLNLDGTFFCCRAAGRAMIARGAGGKIINIVTATSDRASGGIAHTGASRAGVAHLTRTLALEWARFDIQVNAIGPQFLTPGARAMYGQAVDDAIVAATPAGRWARPDEIAAFAVVLASPMSDYVTGVSIPVDGGSWIGPGIDFRGTGVLPDEETQP
jgi:NAD(P)-dependent dehydrogenase (short-subunit alcohol dehydrogenase family)